MKELQKYITARCFQGNYRKTNLLFQTNPFEISFLFFEISFNCWISFLVQFTERLLQNEETICLSYSLKAFSFAENTYNI